MPTFNRAEHTKAYEAGRAAFHICPTHEGACRLARHFSAIAIEQDIYVWGWNSARWEARKDLRNPISELSA